MYQMEIQIHLQEGAIVGSCSAHSNASGVSAAVYAAEGIIQSPITARHAMRPFVKTH